MSAHALSKFPLADLPQLDRTALEAIGWTTCVLKTPGKASLHNQFMPLAAQLGTPVATRAGGPLCDTLIPTEAHTAKSCSLSKIHASGEFPLHNDTAHWLTPCRYVMLACVFPGSGNRPTFLMDTKRLPLSEQQASMLRSTPLRVTNGRNSFFSTILSKSRSFVRYDPGCMAGITPTGGKTLDILSRNNWRDDIENIHWETGKVLVIDNWRVLHGRGHAECLDSDRTLLRISIR